MDDKVRKATRVFLALHEVMLRQGIRALLERQGFEIMGEASTAPEALEWTRRWRPDSVLLDRFLPPVDGLRVAREFHRAAHPAPVILLASVGRDHEVLGAFQAGVHGFVLKTQPIEDLIHAIREVSRGGVYVEPRASAAVIAALRAARTRARDPLSTRETQVLRLVAEGKTTKEVAAALGITVKTADYHRTRLMMKLNIHDTAGLVRYAIFHGLIVP